jgi:hypothetical protein
MSLKPHATIDDSLVQAAGLRALVSAIVASARAAAPGAVEPRDVAARINRTSPYAASILLDLLFEASPSELPLLFDVMAASGNHRLRDRVDRLLSRADLEATLRDRLERARTALKNAVPPAAAGNGARQRDSSSPHSATILSAGGDADPAAARDDEEADFLAPTGLSLLRQVFGPRWIAWTSQRVAHHWLEYLHPARQSERQAALAALLDEWRPDSPEQSDILIPVLELEANWGGARLSRWIVRQLARRPHLQGRALLHRLLHHRDDQVRQLAARAIESSPPLVAPADGFPPPRDQLHYCFVAGFGSATTLVAREAKRSRGRGASAARSALGRQTRRRYPPLHGPGTVLLARRAPDATVRYVLLLLDLDERGVVECWGDDGVSEKEFDHLLRALERVGVGDPLDRVPAALGLLLANGAAALSLANDFVPPMEYYLWRELFTREAYDARHFNVRLGAGSRREPDGATDAAADGHSPTPPGGTRAPSKVVRVPLPPTGGATPSDGEADEDNDGDAAPLPTRPLRRAMAIAPVADGAAEPARSGAKALDRWHDLIIHSLADVPTKPW